MLSDRCFPQKFSIRPAQEKQRQWAMNNIAIRIWTVYGASASTGADRANATAIPSVAKTRVLFVHGIADSAASMRMLRQRLGARWS